MSTDRHFDPAHFAALLDPERARWARPAELLRLTGAGRGSVCADIGCGPGFFVLPLASLVSPDGRVYGVDDSAEMLIKVSERSREAGLAKVVVPIHADAAATTLADGSVEIVFCAFLYHEVASREDLIREFVRILRPGGRLVLADWKRRAPRPPGPPDSHRLTLREMLAPMTAAGLEVERPRLSPLFHVLTATKPA